MLFKMLMTFSLTSWEVDTHNFLKVKQLLFLGCIWKNHAYIRIKRF